MLLHIDDQVVLGLVLLILEPVPLAMLSESLLSRLNSSQSSPQT
jgi:hypothetical protein